jgi:ATP-binding cassette, subfamily B, bacterial
MRGLANRSRAARDETRTAIDARRRTWRVLWETSRVLTLAVCVFVLLEGFLPPLALVAIGQATGRIPAAVRDGLDSAAGRALIAALALGAGAYALSLLRGPFEDLLSAHCSAAVATTLQRRLVAAVCAPAGIEHLEEPETLDRLAAANGELTTTWPSEAPMALAGALGDRLQGLLACAVLASFRWWVGLLFLAGWAAMRPPLRRLLASRALLVRRATPKLRHSWYYLAAAWRADHAKETRLFGLGSWFVDRHRSHWTAGMAPSHAEARRFERRALAFGGLIFVMYLVGTGELARAAYDGSVSLRTIAVMLPMFMMAMQVGGVSAGDVALEQMLASVPDVDALTAALAVRSPVDGAGRAVPESWSEIVFEGVSYAYPGQEQPVLDRLELALPAGRSLGIVGENGAGKTTLVTLLARLRDPTGGRIAVDGLDLASLDARDWQRRIAVVNQDFTRFPLSALENVALVDLGREVDRELVEQAVERAGAVELIAGLPHGWETILAPGYRGGSDLSGGQWQRIALARALYAVARGAGVLVLDEPTAQLDIRAEAAFYDRFLELTRGVTTIVISHRFPTVRRADRIVVLGEGRVQEDGTHDELLGLGGRYAGMFAAQAAGFRRAAGPEGS